MNVLYLGCFSCLFFCTTGFPQDRGIIQCESGMDKIPAWTGTEAFRNIVVDLSCGQKVSLLSLERGFWRVDIGGTTVLPEEGTKDLSVPLLLAAAGSVGREPAPPAPTQLPTSFTCTSNAMAWRDFDSSSFAQRWEGPMRSKSTFGVIPDNATGERPLSDKVFSGLSTEQPLVRSIRRAEKDVPEQSAEFKAAVLGRTKSAVFLVWTNRYNKAWLAVVDLEAKKAMVTHVNQGGASIGSDVETLDCR